MKIKPLILFVVMSMLFASCEDRKDQNFISIIPEPYEYTQKGNGFEVNEQLRIISGNTDASMKNASYLAAVFTNYIGHTPQIIGFSEEEIPEQVILLQANLNDPKIGDEGYYLMVSRTNVVISANTDKGVFYGMQSFLQLLPPSFFADGGSQKTYDIPAVEIIDKPRFSYRGMHLDVGRHLFPLEFIKEYIDLLAMYKFNNFHWHLTEDQGWRIEIKKYPKLTEVGAWRDETLIGHGGRPPFKFDGKPYGGFYTQEEVKEVVQYAADRHINVIPEIELPGHSLGALAAYPNLACNTGPFKVATRWGVFDDIYCSKDETFEFLEDVLAEVIELFPSKYIHIGGDEAPKTRWEQCPDCQGRIQSEGLKDEHELQSYFIQRIEKYLNSKGRSIIGWDEILEGGLAPNATVMSWRGEAGGIAAAQQGHDAIMTPGGYCYFDHYQADTETEPLAIGGYTSLEKVYSYEPVPAILNDEEAKHILGAQGNVWTEYMTSSDHVSYMVLPRMAALAEVNWTPAEKKDWLHFYNKIQDHFVLYEALGYQYSKGSYVVSIDAVPNGSGGYRVQLETEIPGAFIYYSLDGSEPDLQANRYEMPFTIEQSAHIKAVVIEKGHGIGKASEQRIQIHKATGIQPVVKIYPSSDFADGEVGKLTDGLMGSKKFTDGNWLGFSGSDLELELEFSELTTLSNVQLRFYQSHPQWIFLPLSYHIEVIGEGETLHFDSEISEPPGKQIDTNSIIDINIDLNQAYARKLILTVTSPKICPDWHRGAGQDAWIFVDEVVVN